MLKVLWLMNRLCIGVLGVLLVVLNSVSWWKVMLKLLWLVVMCLSRLLMMLWLFFCIVVRFSLVCIFCFSVWGKVVL